MQKDAQPDGQPDRPTAALLGSLRAGALRRPVTFTLGHPFRSLVNNYMQSPEQYEDEFHSSFRIYLSAVKILSGPAETQCELMGNYNVAWELKDDVCAGKYFVGLGYLTANQEAWVQVLSEALGAINTQALTAGASKAVNLLAMNHPGWEPIRYLAKEVVRQLAPLEAVNAQYSGIGSNGANKS